MQFCNILWEQEEWATDSFNVRPKLSEVAVAEVAQHRKQPLDIRLFFVGGPRPVVQCRINFLVVWLR